MLAGLVDRFGRMLTDRNARSYGRFEPSETAVLLLCPQVDAFIDDGEWSKLCRIRPAREKLADFLSKCRECGLAVYHSPMVWSGDSKSSAVGSTRHFRELRARGLLKQGMPGAELDSSLIASSDHVLPMRSGLNAFVRTGLLERLQQDKRGRLIILGGVVNADLDSSARSAVEYDLDVTVLKDLTSAYSARDWVNTLSITLPRVVARVSESSEVLDSLSQGIAD